MSGLSLVFGIVLWLLAGLSLLAAATGYASQWLKRRKFRGQQALEDVKGLSWQEFEQFIADLFRRQGFRVDEVGGQNDGGVDLRLRAPNGDTHLVQCKLYRTWTVGVPKVREFYGAMAAFKTRCEGIFVTCGRFTQEALDFAAGKPIRLIDGDELLRMMQSVNQVMPVIDTHLSLPNPTASEPVCPRCNVPMIRRTAKTGARAGQPFYGCRNFPRCREIVNVTK